jgi:hypothetical protein
MLQSADHSAHNDTLVSVRNAGLTLDEIARTTVARTVNDAPVRIRDIGTLRMATADPRSFYRINGKPGVTLVIDKAPSTNTLCLADAVVSRIEELRKTLPGSELIPNQTRAGICVRNLTPTGHCFAAVSSSLFPFLGHSCALVVLRRCFLRLFGVLISAWSTSSQSGRTGVGFWPFGG